MLLHSDALQHSLLLAPCQCTEENMYKEILHAAGALKTLGANKDLALPIKLFELSDVILLAPEKEVGSKNQRQLVAVYCSKDSGFEVIHGLLNRVMEVMGVPLRQGPDSRYLCINPLHCCI